MSKTALLFNPSSGKGRSLKMKPRIDALLHQLGVDYDLFVSDSEAHLVTLAHQKAAVYPFITAVGGDTTFNLVADQVLNFCPAPALGFIGTGSANDLVRALGLCDLQDACAATARRRVRPMDVGFVKIRTEAGETLRRFFLGTLSAGLGTTVNRYVDSFHRLHPIAASLPFHQLSAGLMGMKHSFKNKRLPLQAEISYVHADSGQEIKRNADFSLLVFGNIPYYADGLKLFPGETSGMLFDGLLDCCILHTASFSAALRAGLNVARGKQAHHPHFSFAAARSFRVRPTQPMDIQVDGDIIADAVELQVSVQPGILKVLT